MFTSDLLVEFYARAWPMMRGMGQRKEALPGDRPRATIGKVKRIETKLNTHLTGQSGAYCIFGFISGQFLWVLRSQTQQPQVGPVRFAAALRRGRPAASPSRPRAPTREAECRDYFGKGLR